MGYIGGMLAFEAIEHTCSHRLLAVNVMHGTRDARPTVTFPAAANTVDHLPWAGTHLTCLEGIYRQN